MDQLRPCVVGLALFGLGCGSDLDDPEASGAAPADAVETSVAPDEQTIAGVRPRESAVDQLIIALGGAEALASLARLRVEGTGTRNIPNEGLRPGDAPIEANRFERAVSIDLERDALRVDTSRDIEFLFPGSQQYSDIVRGNLGASTQPFFGAPLGALGSDKVASIRRQEALLTPHLLLRELEAGSLESASDVTIAGVTYHRAVASGGPAPLTLLIDAATGELAKLTTLELDFYRRDVTLEIDYSDWQRIGDINFPMRRRVLRAGQTLFVEEVSRVIINPVFSGDTFEFPDGVTPRYDPVMYARGELSHQWYYLLDSIGLPFSGIDAAITPTQLALGVLQLVGGSHHSLLVEQDFGLVLVDAPLYEDRGRALVNFIAEEFTNKPLAYVVASHFHEDHVSGVREVLGLTGATLIVHESVEAFWRELLSAPSTLRPDALARSPRDVRILTVPEGGERVIPDRFHPLTIYHLPTAHAADMLLTREPASNTIFVVDIYSPGNASQFGAADLDAALTEYSIPTAGLIIAGGHGGEIHGYENLRGFLGAGAPQ